MTHPSSTSLTYHLAPKLVIGTTGTYDCPDGYELLADEDTCRNEATAFFELAYARTDCLKFAGPGCLKGTGQNKIYFSNCDTKPLNQENAPVCTLKQGNRDINSVLTELTCVPKLLAYSIRS